MDGSLSAFGAGAGFEDAYLITLFLIVPFTVDLIQNIGITILQAENKLAFRSVVFLIASVVNIAISIPGRHLFRRTGLRVYDRSDVFHR